MGIFSEELLWLDRNTTQYMIDEMQDTIDEMKGTIDGMKGTINGMKGTIKDQQRQLQEEQLARQQAEQMARQAEQLARQQAEQLAQQAEQRQLEDKRKNLITLIKQIRNLTAKGISPEECSELLAADEHLVQTICKRMQDDPDAEENDIYHLLIKEEIF